MRAPSTIIHRLLSAACLAIGIVSTASARLDDVGHAPPSTHRLKFFVDPQLAGALGTAEAGRRLTQYVADVNTVFVRETVRSFVFDPAVDLQWITPTAAPPCRCDGLVAGEIAVCIGKSTRGYSHGGLSLGWTRPYRGVVWNMNWQAIHDPLRLSKASVSPSLESTEKDYLARQLKTLIHELEHVFGAGSGEYYNTAFAADTTGVAPTANLALTDDADLYWWSRQNWRLDPLLGTVYDEQLGPATNRVTTLNMIRFTQGTRASINTDWSDWPKLVTSKFMSATSATQVRVFDRGTRAALAGARVSVWRVPAAKQTAILLDQGATDSSGRFVFDWGCGFTCFDAAKAILLVKASAPGRAPVATWFTVFDAFEQKAVQGQSVFAIDLALGPPDTRAPTMSLIAPAVATVGQPSVITPVVAGDFDAWGVKVMVGQGGIPVCTFHAPPYACLWVPTTAGIAAIRVIGMDAAGNTSVASTNVIVRAPAETPPPAMSLLVPATAQAGAVASLRASVSAHDGITELKFIVDGKTVCALPKEPYVCAWRPQQTGYANVEARATDTAGNFASVSATTRVIPWLSETERIGGATQW